MQHHSVNPDHLPGMLEALSRPWHADIRRESAAGASGGCSVDLSGGYQLEFAALGAADRSLLLPACADFRRFMLESMGVSESGGGYSVRLESGAVCGHVSGSSESFAYRFGSDGCVVRAPDADGLRRGLFFLEDEMALHRHPLLPIREGERHACLSPRIVRSPIAPYRWLSGWELEDDRDYYPDEYLNSLAHCGVNGIWVAGLFRNLIASEVLPELGPEEHRLRKLRELAARTRRYGIRTYLFCIEPRMLPPEHALRRNHPELCSEKGNPCVSTEPVREYLREAARSLVEEAPDLGGIINIFNGERYTTCWYNEQMVQACPRCRERVQEEVLAESLDCIVEGFRRGRSDARLLAWSYAMMDPANRHRHPSYPSGSLLEVMRRSDPGIGWLCNFEHGGSKTVAGKRIGIFEYALSYTGPSDTFREFTAKAGDLGRDVYAKLQTGTTYELASQPWLPQPVPAIDKILACRKLGVTGAMLTWIPGGWPAPILKATCEAAFSTDNSPGTILARVAGVTFGQKHAQPVCNAWRAFADAYQKLPFCLELQREAPLTRSPQYHLTLETEPRLTPPYNWGLTRQRLPHPFRNDVANWLGEFTCDEMVGALRRMSDAWEEALQAFEAVGIDTAPASVYMQEAAISRAALIQFRSCANVYEFADLRVRLLESEDDDSALPLMRRMLELGASDRQLALDMLPLLSLHPAIGYHPEIYAFSVSPEGIREKVRQVDRLMMMLAEWLERKSPDRRRLAMTVEQSLAEIPDRWGD
jgi:hypothetical protein